MNTLTNDDLIKHYNTYSKMIYRYFVGNFFTHSVTKPMELVGEACIGISDISSRLARFLNHADFQ